MTSSQESLSQSILEAAPFELKQAPLQRANELLDDAERMQIQVQSAFGFEGAGYSSHWKSKMTEVKDKLRIVNQMLQAEKKAIAELRADNSLSQSEQDSTAMQNMMQQKASNLLNHQKRLLKAFQMHKSLMDAITEQENQNNEDTQLPVTCAIQCNNIKQGTEITSKPNACNNEAKIVDKGLDGTSFAIINRKVMPFENFEASKHTKHQQITGAVQQHDLTSCLGNVNIADDKTKTENDVKNSNQHLKEKLEMQSASKRNYQKRKNKQPTNRNNQIPSIKIKACSELKESSQETGAVKIQDVITKLCENDVARRKQHYSELNHTNAKRGYVTAQSDMLPIPFLQQQESHSAVNDVDVMKLKFVVTIKNEEFLKSSAFLPENFWSEKAFDCFTADGDFLERIGFD